MLKKINLFRRDFYNIIIFFQNFIQKYVFYIWVYFKGGTKSKNGKLLGTKSRRNFLRLK